jgi:DNA repair exonuclease SbcCD ATPase subunit
MTDRDISNLDADTQNYIKELREEAKTRRLEVSDLNTKIQERDSLVAQANQKLDELNGKVAQGTEIATKFSTLQDEYAQTSAAHAKTQLELNRIYAAQAAKLDISFAERLKGDSPDELKADAEKFKQSLGGSGVGPATGDRTNTTGASAPMTEHEGLTKAIARHFAELGE